jgi:hypothetical protein
MWVRSQAAKRWCSAIAVSLEVPRQEGRPRSLSAITASGQSRVQNRIGPTSLRPGRVSSCLGSSDPAKTVTRPLSAMSWARRSQVPRYASRPSAATCKRASVSKTSQSGSWRRSGPVTVDLPVPLAPGTTNSGRSGNLPLVAAAGAAQHRAVAAFDCHLRSAVHAEQLLRRLGRHRAFLPVQGLPVARFSRPRTSPPRGRDPRPNAALVRRRP